MAFTLAYSVTERNDNLVLTITDTTGTDVTGWGNGANPTVASITADGGAHPLLLTISITTSDDVTIDYAPIDLHETFLTGGHTTTADLVFPLTMADLKVYSVAAGTDETKFPDGIYEITYQYDSPATSSTTGSMLVDGVVTAAVYALLRTIPAKYECGCLSEESRYIMFLNTYLRAIEVSAYVARIDSVLDQLSVLENLLDDVSTYSW
jgi:hypothetical protein